MPQLEASGSQVREHQEGQKKGAPGTEASPGGEGGRRATGSVIVDQEFSHVVQSLSRVRLSASDSLRPHRLQPGVPVCHCLLEFVQTHATESVMPSNCLILCYLLRLLPSILPTNGVFSNELALHIRWPKYWSFRVEYSLEGLLSRQAVSWTSALSSKTLNSLC